MAPIEFGIEGRDPQGRPGGVDHVKPPILLAGMGRCRKCDHCLKFRQRVWAKRAVHEFLAARRTWFGTLTLRPDEHARLIAKSHNVYRRKSLSTDTVDCLGEGEVFARKVRSVAPELTKYLKRIRFESEAELRYFLVAEPHKSGLPHFHLLVHERNYKPITKEILQSQWKLGFSFFKLCYDEGGAKYVAKYLSKSAHARVRASKQYGAAAQIPFVPPLHYSALSHSVAPEGEKPTRDETTPRNETLGGLGVGL